MNAFIVLFGVFFVTVMAWVGLWRKSWVMKGANAKIDYVLSDPVGNKLAIVDSNVYWQTVHNALSLPPLMEKQIKICAATWLKIGLTSVAVFACASLGLYFIITATEPNQWTYRTSDMMLDIVFEMAIFTASLATFLKYNSRSGENLRVYTNFIHHELKALNGIPKGIDITVKPVGHQSTKSVEV